MTYATALLTALLTAVLTAVLTANLLKLLYEARQGLAIFPFNVNDRPCIYRHHMRSICPQGFGIGFSVTTCFTFVFCCKKTKDNHIKVIVNLVYKGESFM